jgi:uncharacterized membrane protein
MRARMLLLAGAFALCSGEARADLRLCNLTPGRIGVALGYPDGAEWITEGWFNLRPNRCETIIRGALPSRFFYIHAIGYDRGGEWSGTNLLCTRETEFSIRGAQDCYARGYDRSGFVEIDTGQQPDWTIEFGEGGVLRAN